MGRNRCGTAATVADILRDSHDLEGVCASDSAPSKVEILSLLKAIRNKIDDRQTRRPQDIAELMSLYKTWSGRLALYYGERYPFAPARPLRDLVSPFYRKWGEKYGGIFEVVSPGTANEGEPSDDRAGTSSEEEDRAAEWAAKAGLWGATDEK